MTGYREKAMRMIERARPASGGRPQTEAEWQKVQAASVELGYAMYRDQGMDKKKARSIAELIHGGAAGRLLLEMAFPEDGDRSSGSATPKKSKDL
jgi:hypothetical protein